MTRNSLISIIMLVLSCALFAGCSNTQATQEDRVQTMMGGPAPAGVQAQINAQQAAKQSQNHQ